MGRIFMEEVPPTLHLLAVELKTKLDVGGRSLDLGGNNIRITYLVVDPLPL